MLRGSRPFLHIANASSARASTVICLVVVAFALANLVSAQAPMTIDDMRRLPSTPWFGISPDGSRVLYLLNTPDDSGARTDLWLAPADGGVARKLTDRIAIRSVIGWNPTGDAIAYMAPDGEHTALWILRPDAAARVACRVPRAARSAAWLADGTQLTFSARGTGDEAPPGEGVFLCDVRSGRVNRVTPKGYFGLEFAWSPDGQRVAISRQERPGFYEGLESDLVLVDARTGTETPLVGRAGVDRSPWWSPDGTQIAFLSGFGRSGLLPNIGVAVVRPGEGPRDIGKPHDRGGYFEGPFLHGWSADGRDIYYSAIDGLEVPLFRVPTDGGSFRRMPVPVGAREAAYSYSMSRDGSMVAFKISSTNQPPEIFTARSGAGAATRITRLHEPLTARGVPLAERIRWAAPDGDTIEGVILRPPPSAGPGPHALVTVLHGGPASAYNLSFPGLMFFDPYRDQLLAARGYAVFLPNPRGSGGYGERFRSAVRRDWGALPAADVHAGIDHLIARGIADSTRLALMGWSYGGYLGAWMLSHSDRFSVASVGAGVYDLTSHYGQAAPQMEEYFGGPPWRLPGLYRDQSPVQHVSRIRTPTLLFHGETDNAVSIAQSELLAAALRAEDVPIEFVRYPGEGHSLRQARTQNDSFERLMAWLERWIGSRVRPLQAGQESTAVRNDAPSDDVTTLDGIIGAYYDVISGPAGTAPDRARDARLHHPEALVAMSGVRRDGSRWLRTMSLDEYHEQFGGTRREGFYEREINRQVQRFGSIAHVWSTYESSREPRGHSFARGINSIQLYHDGTRWWITSWVFDSERRGNPIPSNYLPRK